VSERRWLRLWFSFRDPVDRRTDLPHGGPDAAQVRHHVVAFPDLPEPDEWIFRAGPPMREWSPYREVNPPHLDGYFRATQGEFRLIALPGNRTRLEGRTRYVLDMFPQSYWTLPADRLVTAIHRRVLRHIKAGAEEEEHQ